MAKFKDGKQVFSIGDVVKLVNIGGLYTTSNYGENVRLELGETYPIAGIGENLIFLLKSDGTTEGCFPYRVELSVTSVSAESLRNSILGIRSKRESLQKEVLQLEEQEKELVSQLKDKGFALID